MENEIIIDKMYLIFQDVRDKFIAWIGFSVLSVLLLFSGAIYVVIISWVSCKNIRIY